MTKKHSARNGNILAGIRYGQWGGERLRACLVVQILHDTH